MLNDLKGKFHAHITVTAPEGEFQPPKGWKVTIIVLNKGDRSQQDVMITRHFMVGSEKTPYFMHILPELLDANNQLLAMGLVPARTKLEHEDLPTVAPTAEYYRECHIKIRVPTGYDLQTVPGYVQSRNPMEVAAEYTTVFLNARYYSGTVEEVDDNIDAAVMAIRITNPGCAILEVKKESTVVDTNLNLDKWWA